MESKDRSNKNAKNNEKGIIGQRGQEEQQAKQGGKGQGKGDINVKTVKKNDNEFESKWNVNGDKSKLVGWARNNGIPTDWVKDFDSFSNMANIYADSETGRNEFYEDYSVKGGKQKSLAQRLFNQLEKYRKKSKGM